VTCGPPGIGAKKFHESSRDSFGITYVGGSVALESAVINLEVAILNKNSSALEVACGPPGIGAKKVQETSENRF
jgi:hypothetical protein